MPETSDPPAGNGGADDDVIDRSTDRIERLEKRQRVLFEALAVIAQSHGALGAQLQRLLSD